MMGQYFHIVDSLFVNFYPVIPSFFHVHRCLNETILSNCWHAFNLVIREAAKQTLKDR